MAKCGKYAIGTLLLCLTLSCDFIHSERVLSRRRENTYQHFIDVDIAAYPKCCPLKTALVATDDSYNCTANELKLVHFDIFSNNVVPHASEGSFMQHCANTHCVDLLKDDTTWQVVRMQNCAMLTAFEIVAYFPKCCPIDYAYDPEDHKCVRLNDAVYSFDKGLQVINATLSHCPRNDYAIVDFQDSFNIKDDRSVSVGERKFNFGSYCIDWNVKKEKEMVRACVEYEDACEVMGKRCLKKCCPDGEIYRIVNKKPLCLPYVEAKLNVANHSRFNASDLEYGIIPIGAETKYISTSKHIFFIDETGDFHMFYESKWLHMSPYDANYCAEQMKLSEESEPTMEVMLFYNPTTQQQFIARKNYIHAIILAFSCIFLFLTIGCYVCLPEMQNVHGKSILMFCIFMFVGFLTLCVAKVVPPSSFSRFMCTSIGFAIAFTFLGAFAWMNVICFDMWMAFGTMRVLNVNNKRKDLNKFLTYNLYGCGVPLIICGFALIVYQTNILPFEFVPHIGTKKCTFQKLKNTYDYLLYFVIPESIMILINIILFVKTAAYCYKVKNEIQKMRSTVGGSKEAKQRRLQDDKEKLSMLIKLFLVMGIPWTFEAIASYAPHKTSWTLIILETIADCVNASQGIIIFCIFILKKKVWISIKTRLGIMPSRRVSELSTGITNDYSGYGNSNNTHAGNGVGHYNM